MDAENMNFDELTFEALPKAVSMLINHVLEIKQSLTDKANTIQPETDCWMNLEELCEYLPDKPTKPTVYTWVQHDLIPVHKVSKRLCFLKSEINDWLMQRRKKTTSELRQAAEEYGNRKKRKG